MVTVEQLNIYPLKSGRRIEKASIRLLPTGFEWDRHWMIIDAGGTFLSQRTHPRLAWIQPELSDTHVTFDATGLPPLTLPLAPTGEAREVQVWKDRCEGLDQGEAASEWASSLLCQPVRLVRVVKTPLRLASAQFAGPDPPPVTFVDGFPILICNRASLEDLNSRMPEPVSMERFRPNIVLQGLPAFAEDRIGTVRIGGVTLRLVKPCTRCVITSTDQLTGEPGTNPLPVLRKFRFDRALLGVTFGENAIPVMGAGGSIERNAECVVTYDA